MPTDPARSDRDTFAYLVGLVGRRPLVSVAGWMVLASATEGIGLLMLVPLTQVVSGTRLPGIVGEWAAPLANLPLSVLLGGFVALIAMRALIVYRVRVVRAELGFLLTRKLRSAVQRAIIRADWRWLSGERSSDYAALVVGQADRLGRQVDQAIELVTISITIAFLLVTAFWLAWQLTVLTLAMAVVFGVVAILFRRERNVLGEMFTDAYRQLHQHLAEGFAHLRAARIAGAERALTEDFDRVTERLQIAEWNFQRSTQQASLTMQVVTAVILAAIVLIALRVQSMPLALFVPVLAIFLRIAPLVAVMQQGWRAWRFCRPALAELLGTIEAAQRAAEPEPAAGDPLPFAREIVLDGVTLAFAGRAQPVFSGFSLTIPHGSVVAVAGPSGSGKSTLADMLSGLIAPDEGAITVDGVPLRGEARIRWRRQVAYVEQIPFLLDASVADNLVWGLENVSEAAIEAALKEASAQFVFALPEGTATRVGETGRELSGGERQRISLARALLRDPSLVILDEATAALDARNEAAVARTIEARRGTTTFVILGHRPALHALADVAVQLGEQDG